MDLAILGDELWFPPVSKALDDGLLAVGGDLSKERLLLAYSSGIFPWYADDDPILWWSPDPRFVLFPDRLKVSKSMKQVINSQKFEFRINTSFAQVIAQCSTVKREGQPGTWISEEIIAAYTELHHEGVAHCAEAWSEGKLVGGLYGILIGRVFFGESMFSTESNASKFAFIHWVRHLQALGVALIDCQVHTAHLGSLGASMIPRVQFMDLLSKHTAI